MKIVHFAFFILHLALWLDLLVLPPNQLSQTLFCRLHSEERIFGNIFDDILLLEKKWYMQQSVYRWVVYIFLIRRESLWMLVLLVVVHYHEKILLSDNDFIYRQTVLQYPSDQSVSKKFPKVLYRKLA
jgi:hypothetical protein